MLEKVLIQQRNPARIVTHWYKNTDDNDWSIGDLLYPPRVQRIQHYFGWLPNGGTGTYQIIHSADSDYLPTDFQTRPQFGVQVTGDYLATAAPCLRIGRSAYYHLDVIVEGRSGFNPSAYGLFFEPNTSYYQELQLFVRRSKVYGSPLGTQFTINPGPADQILYTPLDQYSLHRTRGPVWDVDNMTHDRNIYDSIPWSMEGSTDIWLEEGDLMWFGRYLQCKAGINFTSTMYGRWWSIRHVRFNMHKISSDDMLDNNKIPQNLMTYHSANNINWFLYPF